MALIKEGQNNHAKMTPMSLSVKTIILHIIGVLGASARWSTMPWNNYGLRYYLKRFKLP